MIAYRVVSQAILESDKSLELATICVIIASSESEADTIKLHFIESIVNQPSLDVKDRNRGREHLKNDFSIVKISENVFTFASLFN